MALLRSMKNNFLRTISVALEIFPKSNGKKTIERFYAAISNANSKK